MISVCFDGSWGTVSNAEDPMAVNSVSLAFRSVRSRYGPRVGYPGPWAKLISRTRQRTTTPSIGDSYRCRSSPVGVVAVHSEQVSELKQSPAVLLGTVRSGAPIVTVVSQASGPGSVGHRSWLTSP